MNENVRPNCEQIDEIRNTGYFGREPWLAELDLATARRLISLRLIERAASHMVLFWVQGDMPDQQCWNFRLNVILLAREPVEVVEWNLPPPDSAEQHLFLSQWGAIRSCLASIEGADAAHTDFGSSAVIFLAAAMVITQWTENMVLPSRTGGSRGGFVMSSSHVGEGFLNGALAKLGWAPFSIAEGVPLQELSSRVVLEMEELLRRTTRSQ